MTHFADRGSLAQYVEKPFGTEGDGGVPLRRRLSWTRQIALALHYIHRENFVHRTLCVPARNERLVRRSPLCDSVSDSGLGWETYLLRRLALT